MLTLGAACSNSGIVLGAADMTTDEKTCPRCAETVKAAAQVCRYCGFNFAAQQSRPVPDNDFLSSFSPNNRQVARVLIVAALAIGVTYCVTSTGTQNPTKEQGAAVMVDSQTRKECGEAIAKAMLSGVVKERPADNRVNVDELAWARMAAGDKTALLSLLACDAYGVRADDLATLDYVVAYGWRSGKRLAMLGSTGITFE